MWTQIVTTARETEIVRTLCENAFVCYVRSIKMTFVRLTAIRTVVYNMHRSHYYLSARSESLPLLPLLFAERKHASQKEFYCYSQCSQYLYWTTTANQTKAWKLSFITLNRELSSLPPPQKKNGPRVPPKWLNSLLERNRIIIAEKWQESSKKRRGLDVSSKATCKVGLIKLLLPIHHLRRTTGLSHYVSETRHLGIIKRSQIA